MFVDHELVVALPETDVVVIAVVVVVAAVVRVVAVIAPRVVADSSGLSLEPPHPERQGESAYSEHHRSDHRAVLMHRP